MKTIRLLMISAILLAGCKTASVVTQVPVNTLTKVTDRTVSVAVPQDSDVIHLTFSDTTGSARNNPVVIKSIDETKTAGLASSFKTDATGIKIRIKTIRDTIRIQAHDSIVVREKLIVQKVPVEVPKPMSFLVKLLMWAGIIALSYVGIRTAWPLIKPFLKL
jgi:uncharacterized protein YcfL